MRKMSKEERKLIEIEVIYFVGCAVGEEYARHIVKHEKGNTFVEDVIDDVMCASAWEDEGYYNHDDIRLAIGRVFMDRMGIEI